MFIIKAQKGSFSFTLTALGWQRDHGIGGYPPCQMVIEQANKVADDQRALMPFDRVWAQDATK